MDLSGKVCLITGGTGGIGSATALEFARRGATVAITGLHADTATSQDTMAAIAKTGARCMLLSGDIGIPSEAARFVEETASSFGRLDALVHCAGAAAPGGLLEVSPEAWQRAFDVHVHAVFYLCRAAVPHMKRQREGAIVLISSAAGLRGCNGALAYGVVKGALPQFARGLARELSEYNIRVNAVAPGVIRTRFQSYLTPAQVRNNVENRIPLKREGTPQDVADAIALLVQNEFITGELLTIDGGMTMRIV
jgi:NAD(P)-dependent dehydrogenase (short-subunit alcohol dehydrogenase family)